jgi:RNA recognition motif-containing protein
MSDADEHCCFVGSLSWSTTEADLKDAFGKFGHLSGAKVADWFLLYDIYEGTFVKESIGIYL